MIIERVLHVRGSSMDFYDSAYFSSYQQLKQRCPDGKVYAYGRALKPTYQPKPVYTQIAAATVLGKDKGELADAILHSLIAPVDTYFTEGTPQTWYLKETGTSKYRRLMCYHCHQHQYLIYEKDLPTGICTYKVPENPGDYGIHYISSYLPPMESDYTVPRAIDLDKFVAEHPEWTWGSIISYATVEPYFLNNPYVPPSIYVKDIENVEHDSKLMDYWFGYYNENTPAFIVPHQTKHLLPPSLVFETDILTFINTTDLEFVAGKKYFSGDGNEFVLISEDEKSEGMIYFKTSDTKFDVKKDYYVVEGTAYRLITAEERQAGMQEGVEYFERKSYYEVHASYAEKINNILEATKGEDVSFVERLVPNTNGDIVYNSEMVMFRPKRTLPIVNGFACFPTVGEDGRLHATGAAQYLADKANRNRQSVLMDFTPIAEDVSFIRLRDLQGTIREFVLPHEYNEYHYSVIIVVDGRIVLPDEYELTDKHVIINPRVFSAEIEADRLLTTGVLYDNTAINVITVDGTRDFYNSDDSFIILIKKPNLQIIQHQPRYLSSERRLDQGSSSYSALHRNMFDANARGLLFDKNLKAVHDYARETRDGTFYAEEKQEEIAWGSSSTFITPEQPLVVLANTLSDNHMSAKVMLFDKARRFVHDDYVIWPRYVILDFIFRG